MSRCSVTPGQPVITSCVCSRLSNNHVSCLFHRVDGYDSWTENFSDSDDAEQAAVVPGYPLIIYPMVLTAPRDTTTSLHPRHRQRDRTYL